MSGQSACAERSRNFLRRIQAGEGQRGTPVAPSTDPSQATSTPGPHLGWLRAAHPSQRTVPSRRLCQQRSDPPLTAGSRTRRTVAARCDGRGCCRRGEANITTRVPAAIGICATIVLGSVTSACTAAAIASPAVPPPPVVTALPASASGQRPVRRPSGQRVDQHAVTPALPTTAVTPDRAGQHLDIIET